MMAAATGRSQVTAATEHSPRFVTAATEHSARVQAQSRAAMQPLPKAMPRHRSPTPPLAAPEHESKAAIAEDALRIVMSFSTMEPLAHTMCGPKPGRTPLLRTGEHVHIWCKTCAELPCRFHCAATHGTCPDCMALRTITQLSPRWNELMWDRFLTNTCAIL